MEAFSKLTIQLSEGEYQAPDVLYWVKDKPLEIPKDLVICKDEMGEPTAVYSKMLWDLNPYRLSENPLTNLSFESLVESKDKEAYELVDEFKRLLVCLIYFAQAGRVGSLSSAVILSYFNELRKAVRFCLSLKENELVGCLTLEELLTNKTYLAAFISTQTGTTFNKRFRAILNHLIVIGKDKVGFVPINPKALNFSDDDSKQTVIIPQRIYLSVIDNVLEDIDELYIYKDRLSAFITEFRDRLFGLAHSTQKCLGVRDPANYRDNMRTAIKRYGLEGLLIEKYGVKKKACLVLALAKIQYVMKTAIHLFTGMRFEEVNRVQYKCHSTAVVSDLVRDEKGNILDEGQTIDLISTTTKFSGYKKSAAWFAPIEVVKVIEILQAITSGGAKALGIKPESCPLLLNCSFINSVNKKEVKVYAHSKLNAPTWSKYLIITEADYAELVASDEERDFSIEEEFQVGNVWPLASHQFRRSLAFYASNTGFVSLPSLKKQYKHLTNDMTRYYRRNFEKIKTIFGFYDAKEKKHVLPPEHMIFDFQMGIASNVASSIVFDLLETEEPLFGKTGGYIQKQKEGLRKGEVRIEEVRSETEKKVDSGELAYKKTLLGGCMKNGRCDSFMLGDFTSCLTCDDASIKLSKVEAEIANCESELESYEKDSGEYQITLSELNRLTKFRDAKMIKSAALEEAVDE